MLVLGTSDSGFESRRPDKMNREVITLSGSTRFKKQFREVERELTLKGKIVLVPAIFGKTEDLEHDDETLGLLSKLHFDKIKISDSIYVIDPEGYVGDHTKEEVEYAKRNNKKIYYYSKEKNV